MSVPPARALVDLPPLPEEVRKWRILLLVSAVNSLTQRVATYLTDLGCERVSTELAITDEAMVSAVLAHAPHVVLCPFLTKKVPDVIWSNVLTLIVHPGPPGDAGPAAIDWAIMGDRGLDPDATSALASLVAPVDRSKPIAERQRSHWGITVLQADHTMDGGPVWAFDQFPLPDVSRTTKSTIYQGPVAAATVRAVTVALTRIAGSFAGLSDPSHRAQRVAVPVDPKWSLQCVSHGVPFLGGRLNERPQIKPGQRRPDLTKHTAADVARIINCGDSQPGGTLKTARSFIFAYDCKIHLRANTIPPSLLPQPWNLIPAGKAIATRDGAVLFKTADCGHGHESCTFGCGVAVWLTHGRLPKPTTAAALQSKVPMAEALRKAGEASRLEGVREWTETGFAEAPGTYQQVFVRSIEEGDAVLQLVYWDFYNGAFSTTGCEHLVRALQWASDPARGNVKVLALMGGGYFSNGVALNVIEAAEHPGRETWANINAIDDVVEVLAGDVSSVPRSDFLAGIASLTERGITTVACVRGNAAAGGVALAAACDVVVAAGTAVFNPAYRAMGLHGSEFHLYSYVERCGRSIATHLVKDMLPLSATRSRELGLVDVVLGGRDTSAATTQALMTEYIRTLASAPSAALGSEHFPSAPWTKTVAGAPISSTRTLVDRMCENKRLRYESANHIPLVNYRHEELSQMLLDSFHPTRSARYHTRRIKFVRKVKAEGTPTRFVTHRVHAKLDAEETAEFDSANGWVRGEEWSWVGLQTPSSMATSANLLIDFAAPVPPLTTRCASCSTGSERSHDIVTDPGEPAPPSPAIRHFTESPSTGSPIGLPKQLPSIVGTAAPASLLSPDYVKDRSSSKQRRASTVGRTPPRAYRELSETSTSLSPSPPDRSTKKRGSSFLGKLSSAFRSRTDLKSSLHTPPVPIGKDSPISVAAGTVVSDGIARSAPTTRVGTVSSTPSYRRPTIANEGNTESPCLFNVTGDFAEPRHQRDTTARPVVVSVN